MSETTHKTISVNYKLYRNSIEGEMVESTEGKEPLKFLSGLGQMIPEFEANIVNLKTGDTFSFGIKAENAYGKKSDDAIVELQQDMFMKDGKLIEELVVDNIIPLQDQNGNVHPAKVLSINEATVTVDVNHPLADQDLYFTGDVIENREATPEEVEQIQSPPVEG